jgi:OOP family OmpA-OmpF porin
MKKIAIAVLLSTVICAPAIAADMYAGVNLGQNKYDFTGTFNKNTSTAFGVLVGFPINENFAAEIAYTGLGSVDPIPGTTVKGSGFSLSGVGTYPINQQFSLFGKVGVARTAVDQSDSFSSFTLNKTDVTFGFGGQYNISTTVGIRAGFDRYKVGSTINTDIMSIGGVFKF